MKTRSPAGPGRGLGLRPDSSQGSARGAQHKRLTSANGRREAIYLALSAAEVCWAAPSFLALSQVALLHPPLLLWLGMLVLLLGFFYIYRALVQANLSLRLQQGLLGVVLLLSLGLFFRFHVYAHAGLRGIEWLLQPFRRFADLTASGNNELVAILALIYLWARGIHLARRSLTAQAVAFSFRAGVVIFVLFGLTMGSLANRDVSPFVAPFFFFSLIAVALARIEEVSRMPGSSRAPGSSFWIGSTMGAVALVVLLGSLLAMFFSGGSLEQVLRFLSPVFVVVQLLLLVVLFLIFGLLDFLVTILPIDLGALVDQLQLILGQLQGLLEPLPQPEAETATDLRILGMVQLGVIVTVFVSLIALVLLFTWWRVHRGEGVEEGESRESLLSAAAVARSLLAMLRSGRDRLSEMAGLVDRFGLGSRLWSAISIRRIYANLVRLATGAGYPRIKAQTPFEYMIVLYEAWPDSESDLTMITNAYVNAHYGQVPDTREELEHIRGCWERVRARRAMR